MSKCKRRPHADLIIAFANGAEIQFRIDSYDNWTDTERPSFFPQYEYRVKPTVLKCKYRVALMVGQDGNSWVAIATDIKTILDKHNQFVKWLTDWIEVEEEI